MIKIPININVEKLKERLSPQKLKERLSPQKLKELFGDKAKLNYFIPALITIIYLFFFFIPEIKALSGRFVECAALKGGIKKVEKTDIDSLKKQIGRLKEKVEGYEKKLPGEKEIPSVLRYLSGAAKEMDVRITEIKPVKQSEDKKQLYYSMPILLKAECAYHALGRFLNALEKADRFMKITDLKMVANPQKSNIHYVQLVIVIYVMGQK